MSKLKIHHRKLIETQAELIDAGYEEPLKMVETVFRSRLYNSREKAIMIVEAMQKIAEGKL